MKTYCYNIFQSLLSPGIEPLCDHGGQTAGLFCGRERDESWPAYYLRD
jgi:hypothetical protein